MSSEDLQKNDIHHPNQSSRCIITPTILILAGLIMLTYAIAFNSVTVVAEKETDKTSVQTTPDDKPTSDQADSLQSLRLSEPQVVRDVTVGGLERLSTGVLKRTYTGEPDALCPT
ncbi:MAG: hypothetical protein ACYS9Y_05720 [Planctomycetota bacterium]|jgi:hypothetical protein